MSTNYVVDLKVARRKLGLSQDDCATLLGTSRSRYSRIESGKARMGLSEICALLLTFGTPFETIFSMSLAEERAELQDRLHKLPVQAENRQSSFNRAGTLHTLAARLETLENYEYGTA